MRIYALRDGEGSASEDLAYLECYERPRSFYLELPPGADPWALPFILHEFAQRGVPTIDAAWSLRWVQARLVPPERQNLGEVLRENGLSDYDELKLLELTGGRCSQDACYLVPVAGTELPAWYADRVSRRLSDVFALSDFGLLAAFRSGEVVWLSARELLGDRRPFARLLRDEEAFLRVTLQPGGHGAQWGEQLAISSKELRDAGHTLPFRAMDVALVAQQALCGTTEAAQLLGCTRQNVSDLVRRGKLPVCKADGRMPLFLRSDVLNRR